LNAQDKPKKFDIRFGIGISLLGTGDMTTINFENEINYKFSQYFSTSFSLNFGRSNSGVFETSSYIQGNLNIFVSPFRNNKKNDFRVGSGFSIMNISDSYYFEPDCNVGTEQLSPYHFNRRNSYGFNIIIEDTYSINDRFLIGLKLFTQPYTNGDINSGILLKLGLKI
jgi:hypothetical protein